MTVRVHTVTVEARDPERLAGANSWVRMTDPEGNEFCILQSQSDYDAFAAENPPSASAPDS